jgi:hemerythrin
LALIAHPKELDDCAEVKEELLTFTQYHFSKEILFFLFSNAQTMSINNLANSPISSEGDSLLSQEEQSPVSVTNDSQANGTVEDDPAKEFKKLMNKLRLRASIHKMESGRQRSSVKSFNWK